MSNNKSSGLGRTRIFACTVWPDSAPEDWISILIDQKISSFISPLHDRDINPTGEPKKAHYHVMIMFDGVKTEEQAREVFNTFGGVGCEKVKSYRGYARYLCHLDNPDKAQYSVDDVLCYGGSDYYGAIDLVIDKYEAIKEIIIYCNENDITCFADLLTYSMVHKSNWFRVLCDSGAVVIEKFLKSKEWKKNYENRK